MLLTSSPKKYQVVLEELTDSSCFSITQKKKPRRSEVSLLGLWPDNPGRVHSYLVDPSEPEDPVEPQTRTFVPKYLVLIFGLVRFQSLVSFRSSPRPKSDLVAILRPFSPSRWLFPSSKRLWRLPQPWFLNRYFTTPCYVYHYPGRSPRIMSRISGLYAYLERSL